MQRQAMGDSALPYVHQQRSHRLQDGVNESQTPVQQNIKDLENMTNDVSDRKYLFLHVHQDAHSTKFGMRAAGQLSTFDFCFNARRIIVVLLWEVPEKREQVHTGTHHCP